MTTFEMFGTYKTESGLTAICTNYTNDRATFEIDVGYTTIKTSGKVKVENGQMYFKNKGDRIFA